MNWNDSDPSDDDTNYDYQPTSASRKRSSRACDQCRKTKSKCERPAEGAQCKSCALAGTACTFLGPSYKRGPPKGYIHAIELRWHQVESLLGALLQCPDQRVQSIVNDLRQDDLAREILHRVDMGPYGPAGRRNQPAGATKEDFFASILRSSGTGRDTSRSRRQSRISREKVSSTADQSLSIVPTQEWQDSVAQRLSSSPTARRFSSSSGPSSTSSSAPSTQRRRLDDISRDIFAKPEWNNAYTLETEDSQRQKDPAESIGELSLDEHQEIRYHGKASGLPLLGRSLRTDDKIEGGIWRLQMARVWPPAKYHMIHIPEEEEKNVDLPPQHIQDNLIELYFTFVHPSFPVIRRSRFLSEYNARKNRSQNMGNLSPSESRNSPRPVTSQEVTPLLLLAIFSLSSRFATDLAPPPSKGKTWESGCEYTDAARNILTYNFHRSRPSTVQALLLMGYREFGIGSMEQGWIFFGMAIRMAMDLGLNCDSAGWKIHGQELFSQEEIETRRQIWWTCCLADRYGSMYMGRPIYIKEADYAIPLPPIDPEEDNLPWQPIYSNINYPTVPGRLSTHFRALADLSVILGEIVTYIYPVRSASPAETRGKLSELENRLDRWYIGLPDVLTFDTTIRRSLPPPPHILLLHVRYWGSVLLLNRAFIPNWKGTELTTHDPAELKAFDLAQAAATHVSNIVTVYRETFTMKRCSPFMTSYTLSAAIMHILTLTLRPSNVQASTGLQQCMAALKDMELVWPSAARAWELLSGVKLGSENVLVPHPMSPDRHKRPADDAFGHEKSSDYLQREIFGPFSGREDASLQENGVQDLSTRIMAHMLGLDIPGIEPSTSYYPGYEWWPRAHQEHPQSPAQSISPATSAGNTISLVSAGPPQPVPPAGLRPEDWAAGTMAREGASHGGYGYPGYDQYGQL